MKIDIDLTKTIKDTKRKIKVEQLIKLLKFSLVEMEVAVDGGRVVSARVQLTSTAKPEKSRKKKITRKRK